MHAKHADSTELNGLSGEQIGNAFTVPTTLGTGFLETVENNTLTYELCWSLPRRRPEQAPRLSSNAPIIPKQPADRSAHCLISVTVPGHQTRGRRPINHAEPSACFACICCHLR
jgi:hypothetical protein